MLTQKLSIQTKAWNCSKYAKNSNLAMKVWFSDEVWPGGNFFPVKNFLWRSIGAVEFIATGFL